MAGLNDIDMEDFSSKYPEYDNMDNTTLKNEYNQLANERLNLLRDDNPTRLEEVKNRMRYIEYKEGTGVVETTFTSNDDGKTVTIKRKGQRSNSAPEAQFIDTNERPINRATDAVQDFIHKNYDNNFRFGDSDREIDLRINIGRSANNNITYRPLTTRNKRGVEQIVLKRDSNGVLQYNDPRVAQEAVTKFKNLLSDIIEEQKDKSGIIKNSPMVDTDYNKLEWEDDNGNINQDVIRGISPKEITELRGVLFPEARGFTPDYENCIKPDGALQKQIDYFSETIGYTERELDRTSDPILRQELEERITGLKEARELTNRQLQLEKIRYAQEEDISRLQKFKKWAKENIAGVSAVAISIAGIITTIVVGARKAIIQGAQATSKFAKAVANLGKKLWPVLGQLLNIIAQAISLGAKGLAWLASNLWVLAIAAAWFVYGYYKQRKNKT